MSPPTDTNYVVLITGANRGLGRGLLELYLQRPRTTVIAANRDVSSASSSALLSLPRGDGSRVVLVKVSATNATDPLRAAAELQATHGIRHVDLAVANAGISDTFPRVADMDVADLRRHLEVNVFGVVWLWQAVLPLLKAATAPKFVTMSSSAGSVSLASGMPIPNSAYGTTKAALNYLTMQMHREEEHVCAFPIDPGWVQTDMGNNGARQFGLEQAPNTTQESVTGMFKVINGATRETSGGKFLAYNGEERPF